MKDTKAKTSFIPLEGIRAVEFTVHWAGPTCGMMLADMGAEVIKIENPALPDASRRFEPFAEDEKGVNKSGYFALLNRGKKDCTLDLKNADTLAAVKKLIATSDIVIENFAPRVLRNFDLGYEELKKIKPDIIMVSLSGYGSTGPDRDCLALGQVVEAYSGVNTVMGYPDKPPLGCGTVIPDQISATLAAFSALSALHHRERTGEGQHIDASEVETLLTCMPESIMEFTINGRLPQPHGNRDETMAPHGCYRCSGEDKWVAIAVSDDRGWQKLCLIMNKPDLIDDERFKESSNRLANQDELDKLIGEWTAKKNPKEVMTLLQNVQIAAAPVYSCEDIYNDPHLREREFFVETEHPETGKRELLGMFAKLSETPGKIRARAPLFGEHNDWFFKEFG